MPEKFNDFGELGYQRQAC